MVKNGFVHAIDKSIEKRRNLEERKIKKSEKFYTICEKYKTDLPSMKKEMLTKSEQKYMVDFIVNVLGYPLDLYPKLK